MCFPLQFLAVLEFSGRCIFTISSMQMLNLVVVKCLNFFYVDCPQMWRSSGLHICVCVCACVRAGLCVCARFIVLHESAAVYLFLALCTSCLQLSASCRLLPLWLITCSLFLLSGSLVAPRGLTATSSSWFSSSALLFFQSNSWRVSCRTLSTLRDNLITFLPDCSMMFSLL